jgi:hypothetical protein
MRAYHQQQSKPERVLQLNEQDTKLDLTKVETNDETKQDEVIKEIPPNTIYGCNLKKIKSYKNIRKSYKLKNQKQVFITDLKIVLNEFPIDNHQCNDELLVEILNIAECYFVYGNKKERESVKNESIIEIMKPYFKDDEELLLKTISHVWHKVSKSNMFKRVLQRFKLFFFQKST